MISLPDWNLVKFSRTAFADLPEDSPSTSQFKYCEDPAVVKKYLDDFRAGQKSVDENPELFYPSALPKEEVATFGESDKAKRLYEILIAVDSSYDQRLNALDWLLTYDYEPAIEWFHKSFQERPSRYMGYRRAPSDWKFHDLLSANGESLKVIEGEIRTRVEASGGGLNYAKLLQKVAPERFLDFCQTELDRQPRSWYARWLSEDRPSLELVESIRKGLKESPDEHWYVPIAELLKNEETRKAALGLVNVCEPDEPIIGWWSTIGKYGTDEHREKALAALEKFELTETKCSVLYEIDKTRGLAAYDRYLETLDAQGRRSFEQMTYYPYECYYGMKIDDDQLEFIKWVIRTGLESYAIEALCEAWRGSEGDSKAAEDLGPTLLEAIKAPERSDVRLAYVSPLGQLFRGTANRNIVDVLIESAETCFAEPDQNTIEIYARNLQLIGGEHALAAAKSFWDRIDEAELAKTSFTRWLDQQWCKQGLTVEKFLEDLQSKGHVETTTPEDLYMAAWEQFNDRRQSAPSLGIYAQGFFESVIWGLDATPFATLTYDEMEDVLKSMHEIAKDDFVVEGLQTEANSAEFVFNNRLVQFESEDSLSYNDIGVYVDLANQLLELEGDVEKQFVLLPRSEDNGLCLLFDTPQKLKTLTEKYFLLLPDDQQL